MHALVHGLPTHTPLPSALAQVAAWRSHRRLPLAVEATASLKEAVLNDPGWAGPTPSHARTSTAVASEYSLRLHYALTIIK
jgi:hypothetical protein